MPPNTGGLRRGETGGLTLGGRRYFCAVGQKWDMEGQCWSLQPLPTAGSASAPAQPQAFNAVLTQVSSSNWF